MPVLRCDRQPTEIDIWVGRYIARRRRSLGLSQTELARAACIGVHRIRLYETAAQRPRPAELAAMAQVLGLPITQLFAHAPVATTEVFSPRPRPERQPARSPPRPATPGADRRAAAEVREIVIASSEGFPFLPLLVMKAQHLVEQQAVLAGIDDFKVSYDFVEVGSLVSEPLLNGQAQFAASGVPPFLCLWDSTRDNIGVRALYAINCTPSCLAGRYPYTPMPGDFDADELVALHRRPQGVAVVLLQMVIAQALGLLHFERLGASTSGLDAPVGVDAVVLGAVDADIIDPARSHRELKIPGINSVTTSDQVGANATFSLFYTTTLFTEQNPRVTQVVMKAIDQAIDLVRRDHRAAGERFRHSTQPFWAAFTDYLVADQTMTFGKNPKGLMECADFMHSTGRIKMKPADWQDFFIREGAAALGN